MTFSTIYLPLAQCSQQFRKWLRYGNRRITTHTQPNSLVQIYESGVSGHYQNARSGSPFEWESKNSEQVIDKNCERAGWLSHRLCCIFIGSFCTHHTLLSYCLGPRKWRAAPHKTFSIKFISSQRYSEDLGPDWSIQYNRYRICADQTPEQWAHFVFVTHINCYRTTEATAENGQACDKSFLLWIILYNSIRFASPYPTRGYWLGRIAKIHYIHYCWFCSSVFLLRFIKL